MKNYANPFVWAFLVIAFVWLRRIYITIRALHLVPVVRPSRDEKPCSNYPLISVVVPAKNEETNIHDCIASFLKQDYPNIEIIIANDNSVDDTEAIIRSFGDRVTCFNVLPTPEGWSGKNYAVHTALEKASGEWFLFSDADTRHEPESVSSAFRHAVHHDLGFLTLTPRCLAESLAEKMIQPTAMGYMGLWFPLDRINAPGSPLVFGNGQFLFIKRSAYEEIGGHAAVSGEMHEDFALMRNAKLYGVPAQCAIGVPVYGTRMYDSFPSIWRGWRRIFLLSFRKERFSVFMKAVSVFAFSFMPFLLYGVVLLQNVRNQDARFTLAVGTIVLVLIMSICLAICVILKVNKRYVLYHPVAALVLSFIMLDVLWMSATNKKIIWR
jgi:glycosyltransferase involved in cell wall biosynthesis